MKATSAAAAKNAVKPLLAAIVAGSFAFAGEACGGGSANTSRGAPKTPGQLTTSSDHAASTQSSTVRISGDLGRQPVHANEVAEVLDDLDKKRGELGPHRGGLDADDPANLAGFGSPAGPADAHAIIAAAKRYYAAASHADAKTACAMMTPAVERRVAVEFGRFGYAYAHNAKTCVQTMQLIFDHLRHALSARVLALNVLVKGDQAYVAIGSKTLPTSLLTVQRSAGAWKIAEPLAGDLW
jgi:ketosteroid isomerase-like protein